MFRDIVEFKIDHVFGLQDVEEEFFTLFVSITKVCQVLDLRGHS